MVEQQIAQITQAIVQRFGPRVLSGPFAGMRYVGQPAGSALVPKLLGSYEQELQAVVEDLIERQPQRVANIGCGEGYYAVGLALRLPSVQVYAFDVDPLARQLCAELADLNGVADRVQVLGRCTPEALRPLVGQRCLVVCDCEGDEIGLLQPGLVPGLLECDLLVELHDCYQPAISPLIRTRFSPTHGIAVIDARERDPNHFGLLDFLSAEDQRLALAEFRPPGMQWAVMMPIGAAAKRGTDGSVAVSPDSAMSKVSESPTLITACILARNEESRIEAALQCLQGWTDQIIVIDNESEDGTVAIARRYTDCILTAPRATNFDAIRNRAVEHATGAWIFYLDADERVPPRLGAALRRLVHDQGRDVAAFYIPFRHYFCGKWIEHSGWTPGYTRPQLLKKGAFHYNERVHSGVEVNGRACFLPPDEEDLTIAHYSYEDLSHYLTKLNTYTDAEAENLLQDDASHSWQAQLAHFVRDWQYYYERGRGDLDGMHGFVLAFMAGTYRLLSRAKLWDLRRKRGELIGPEPLPASTREMLEFMARVAQEGAAPWLESRQQPAVSQANRIVGHVPPEWYRTPPRPRGKKGRGERSGIAGCIVARNEEERIEAALQSLVGWTDKIIVIDNESDDRTAEIARRYAEVVLTAPRATHLEAARTSVAEAINQAAFADGDWIFCLDADERVPPQLGDALRRLVRERGDEFDALFVPFKNHYYGKWMQSDVWWPGYNKPRLLKKDTFQHGEVIHSGTFVQGRTLYFPADDPSFAVDHYAYDDIRHYLTKLNRYTDAEAEHHDAAGQSHSWQAQLAYFAEDWRIHYDDGRAYQDGMHGFVQSFLCAFYRFVVRAKIWDRRRQRREVSDQEPVPGSLREMLEYMARAAPGAPALAALASSPVATPAAGPDLSPPQNDDILLQSASGDHTRLMELTRERHEAYARAHGMDYLCRLGPQQSERHPCWDKIPVILEVLRQGKYQRIFWMDADTLIADMDRDLREALAEECWLGMVQHGNPPYFNNGVMHIRSTPQAVAFFEEVWKTWPVNSAWEDNEAVIRVLKQDPERWKGVAVLGDEWNSTLYQNECRRPVVRAWHGYGKAADRHASMALCLQDALFKEGRATDGQSPAATPAVVSSGRPTPLRPNANPVPVDPVTPVDFQAELGRPLRIRWEGDQFVCSSLALVNREFCLGLLAAGDVELSLWEKSSPWRTLSEVEDSRRRALSVRLGAALSGPPDITVRHHFPPNWERTETGKLIVIQPWELSHLPRHSWIAGASEHADEVWVHSRFVREAYVRSGVPAERVRLVPLGFNPHVFTPEGARYELPTRKSFRFLFVGGALERKGADLLLAAYQRAFTPHDDVCLIVKDMGTRTFYQGQTFGEAFRQAAADLRSPEVIYLDSDLSEAELASLYRACTCVVLPYRGEGFALPPLEGMACGLPAIVTSGGPTDDYLDDAMALRVPHHRRVLHGLYTGPDACDWDPWTFEPDLDALVDALRWARDHPEQTRERGEAARAYVHAGWTWERAVGVARERLLAVAAPVRERVILPAKAWAPAGDPEREKASKRTSRSRTTSRTADPTRTPASPRSPIELSFCMIARNEESRIANCLSSAAPFVDEMVVVDTGSSDRTREIARDCGARVFDFPWVDCFATARNESLNQARGGWIFWMDADDVLPPESGERLRELIHCHPRLDVAYQANVRIPPGPGEFSETLVDHVKLFPNRPDLRFEHRIHEQILPAIRRAGLEVLFSDLAVIHQNYDRSKEGQDKKRRRDFHLLDLDLRDRPDHPFVLFNLGMTHIYATREYEVAAHYLRRSLDRSDCRDSIVRKAYAMLATARICQQEWAAALAANEQGRCYYPDDAELLFQAGQIYQHVHRFDDARCALERLIEGREDPHYRSVDTGLRTFRGRHELALLFRRIGSASHCAQVLDDITTSHPHYLPAQLDLAETLCLLGNRQEAQRRLEAIPNASQIREPLARLRAMVNGAPGRYGVAGAPGG